MGEYVTKAVLFDIGGTLFTYDFATESRKLRVERMAGALGVGREVVGAALRSGMDRATAEYFVRPYYLHKEFFAAANRYAADELGLTAEQATELFAQPQQRSEGEPQGLASVRPRPGAESTLAEIRRRGLHIGAVSNSDEDQFEAMMQGLGLTHYFDALICSETAQSCKPDAAIFLHALRQAGCEPHEALFVGDTPDHDIAGAEAVGMRTALIVEEHGVGFERGTARHGQVVIRELPELLDLLDLLDLLE